jgi:prevent-host-death family protein
MTTVTIDKAEKQLADLLRRARAGEDIVISDGSDPAVKLTPLERASKRKRGGFGMLKGEISVSDDDLFGPLAEEELRRWEGEAE